MSQYPLAATVVGIATAIAPVHASAQDHLMRFESHASVAETTDRLVKLIDQSGFALFARIDHAAGARKVGQTLRPIQLLIFGNPKGGTPLMLSNPTIGIDLPLKMLVWEDQTGRVWIGYHQISSVAKRHQVTDRNPVLKAIDFKLHQLADQATHRPSLISNELTFPSEES